MWCAFRLSCARCLSKSKLMLLLFLTLKRQLRHFFQMVPRSITACCLITWVSKICLKLLLSYRFPCEHKATFQVLLMDSFELSIWVDGIDMFGNVCHLSFSLFRSEFGWPLRRMDWSFIFWLSRKPTCAYSFLDGRYNIPTGNLSLSRHQPHIETGYWLAAEQLSACPENARFLWNGKSFVIFPYQACHCARRTLLP